MDNFPDGTIFIELRGVYDGWSIAKLPNNTLINRWDATQYPQRHLATQKFINYEQNKLENEDGT